MKEMWTGVYPHKKEYKYEIRFRTDDEQAYLFVQEACRNAIDINWCDEKPDPRLKIVDQETFKAKRHNDFKWIKIDDDIMYDLTENLLVEYKCPKCGKEYLFKTDEMDWNDCGWFECHCGHKVKYEKI